MVEVEVEGENGGLVGVTTSTSDLLDIYFSNAGVSELQDVNKKWTSGTSTYTAGAGATSVFVSALISASFTCVTTFPILFFNLLLSLRMLKFIPGKIPSFLSTL